MGALGGAIGSAVGGLFSSGGTGGISGKGVENRTVGLDQNTVDQMNAQNARSNRSPDDYKQDLTTGTDKQQELNGANQTREMHNNALGGATPDDLNSALNNRAQKGYNRENNFLQKQAGWEAPVRQFEDQSKAFGYAAQHQAVLAGIAQRKRAQQEENANFRNRIIGNLGSALGGGAGALMAKKNNTKPDAMPTSDTQMMAGESYGDDRGSVA